MKNSFFSSIYFHIILFVLTFVTTTYAGAGLITGKFLFLTSSYLSLDELLTGLEYSVPFLAILSAHEFGHYFTAIYHKVKTTLPYYIPFPLFLIGTMGAVIRIKEAIYSRKIFFDIGVAGPLAGFVVAFGILTYAFTHLPEKDHIFSIHPDYKKYGMEYEKYVYDPKVIRYEDSTLFEKRQTEDSVRIFSENSQNEKLEWKRQEYQGGGALQVFIIGDNLLFYFFKNFVADQKLLPHPNEMVHFPFLMAGYFALFFTALNLIPIGQLDGGHILYGLIGYRRNKIASGIIFTGLVLYGGIGLITLKEIIKEPSEMLLLRLPLYIGFLYFLFSRVTSEAKNNLLIAVSVFTIQFLINYFFPEVEGNHFWLFWAFILSRVLGIFHPPTLYDEPLDLKRKILGWISLIIFIICFSPQPLILEQIPF